MVMVSRLVLVCCSLLINNVEGGTPIPGKINPLDLPDDFFRIRLVCTILDTCGHCFDRGSAKKKLDFFLTFFQYYIFTKEPLPMDVDFLVHDTYSVTRAQWKLAGDLQEATIIFSEAVAQNYKTQDAGKHMEPEPEEEDAESSSSDEGLEEDAMPEVDDEQESSDEAEAEASGPNAEQNGDSESEDEVFVGRQEEERDPQAEAEFDRELEKMMADSVDSRRFERKAVFDVPLPMKRSGRDASGAESTESSQGQANTMAFSLMTKKGNKQQVCHLFILEK